MSNLQQANTIEKSEISFECTKEVATKVGMFYHSIFGVDILLSYWAKDIPSDKEIFVLTINTSLVLNTNVLKIARCEITPTSQTILTSAPVVNGLVDDIEISYMPRLNTDAIPNYELIKIGTDGIDDFLLIIKNKRRHYSYSATKANCLN